MRFVEHPPGSIVAASDTTFNRAYVEAWVEPGTGALIQAHVRLQSPGPSKIENQITVVFEPDPEPGVLVPTKMTEDFYFRGYGSGEAVYRRFRQFATGARIVPQP